MSIRCPQSLLWLALGLLVLLPASANAQPLSKDEQRCVNTTNKNAQKLGDAWVKEISECVKDFVKGKAVSADGCLVGLPLPRRGDKILVAEIKYEAKTTKHCGAGSGFMNLADADSAKAAVRDKELDILHMIFGSDVVDPAVITEASNKPDAKCQRFLIKAVYKCQTTKWKEYNKCKKNKIKGKGTTQALTAQEVQDECTGTGPGSIPDDKGKIAKKCAFTDTINKKCPNLNVFPGCPSGTTLDLSDCLDAIVECKWCLANNIIDGLNRDCDEFDDGVVNGSCP